MHAQSQPRPRPANPERAYGVRKTGVRAHAFALLAPVFALLALTLTPPEAHAQAPSIESILRLESGGVRADQITSNNTPAWDVTFSEAVSGVNREDFQIVDRTGTPLNPFSIIATLRSSSGNTEAEVIGNSGDLTNYNGEIFLILVPGQNIVAQDDGAALPDNTLDAIENDNTKYHTYVLDNAPLVEITTNADTDNLWRVGEEIMYTFTFNEAVDGFDAGDIIITLPAGLTAPLKANSFTGNDGELLFTATYTLMGTPTGAGREITSRINGMTILDRDGLAQRQRVAGNPTGPTLQAQAPGDRPTVEITSSAGTGTLGDSFTLTVTFREMVTGFDPATELVLATSGVIDEEGNTVSGGVITPMRGTAMPGTGADENRVWTVEVTIPDDRAGMFTANIAADVAMDADGNTNTAAPEFSASFDTTASLTLTLDDASISENGGTAMLTATLDPAAVALVTVTLTPPAGSGTAFTLGSTSLTIAAGDTSATTTVTARNNPSSDGNLEFVIMGTATSDGSALTDEVTLTIEDDDVFGLPAVQDYTFDAGQTVNITLPQAVNASTAGTVTYTLEGTLPAGLTWDADNRTITGMPTTAAAAVMYTYKATDDRGAATDMPAEDVTFTIAINLVLAARQGALAGDDRLRFDELPVTFPEAVGATATYTLTRADGTPLPEWLTFGDPNSRELRLMDETQARGRVSLLYTATAGDFTATLQVTVGDDLERREDRLGEMVGAVGRTLGWDIAHAIRERARADRSGADTPLRLSGVSENTTLDELVSRGASLDMALNADAEDNGSKGGARVWARVGHSQFDSEPLEDYQQDGELTSLHAGMDFRTDPDRLFGAAVGWHDAQVDYEDRGANVEGDLELEILTINPYASKTRDRWHTWGTVGFGVGEMTYTEQSGDNEDTSESNVTLWNAAGGLEYTLGFIGAAELSARGEGMAVSMQTDESDNAALEFGKIRADAYGVRGEVEVGLPMERADGGTMRPFAVLGMRWEDGDGDADGLSAELGGGITARNADFFVDASVRAHAGVEDEVADVLAWGLALGFDRDNDHRGLAVELNHRAGPQPWDPFADNGLAAASDTTNTEATPATLGATTRYGLDYRNGRMTPYNTLRFDGNLLSEVETGIQYRLSDLSLGLKHVYEPSANADEHTLKLIGRITF